MPNIKFLSLLRMEIKWPSTYSGLPYTVQILFKKYSLVFTKMSILGMRPKYHFNMISIFYLCDAHSIREFGRISKIDINLQTNEYFSTEFRQYTCLVKSHM